MKYPESDGPTERTIRAAQILQHFYYWHLSRRVTQLRHDICYLCGHQWEPRPVTKTGWGRYGWRERHYTNWSCKRCKQYVWYQSDAPTVWDELRWWRWQKQSQLREKFHGKPKDIGEDELPF